MGWWDIQKPEDRGPWEVKEKRVQKTEIARNRMSKVSISELQGKWGRIKFSSSACLCLASSLLLGRVFFIQGPDSQFFNAAIL